MCAVPSTCWAVESMISQFSFHLYISSNHKASRKSFWSHASLFRPPKAAVCGCWNLFWTSNKVIWQYKALLSNLFHLLNSFALKAISLFQAKTLQICLAKKILTLTMTNFRLQHHAQFMVLNPYGLKPSEIDSYRFCSSHLLLHKIASGNYVIYLFLFSCMLC